MALRFTETEKWKDVWFKKLKPEEKLLFLFLIDNCDCAGFWEIDLETASFQTGIPLSDKNSFAEIKPFVTLEQAFESIKKSYLTDGRYIWMKNFLFYQKNLPLNPESSPHKGILNRLNSHNSLGGKALAYIKSLIKDKGLNKGFVRVKKPLCKSLGYGYGLGYGLGKGKGNNLKGGAGGKIEPEDSQPELLKLSPEDLAKREAARKKLQEDLQRCKS